MQVGTTGERKDSNSFVVSREALQRQVDTYILARAPIFGGLGAISSLHDVYLPRLSPLFAASLALPNLLLAVAWGIAGFKSRKWPRDESHVRIACQVAAGLFAFSALNGLARLYATGDDLYVGALVVLLITMVLVVTRYRPFIIVACLVVLGGLLAVRSLPAAERSHQLANLVGAALVGIPLLRFRFLHDFYTARVELEELHTKKALQESVERLTQEMRIRAESEANLRASEARYRRVLDNSLVGIFQCAADGCLVLANEALAQMLGYRAATELLGKSLTDYWPSERAELSAETVAQQLPRLAEGSCESRLIRRDGESIHAAIHIRPAADAEPGAAAYEGLVIDISDRHAAEEALRRQREQLGQVSRMAALGEMLAGIAHEIHQPLHNIANFAAASVNTLAHPEIETAKLRDWNRQIHEEATRAGEILRGLRRIATRVEAKREPIDVPRLIDESLALTRGAWEDDVRIERNDDAAIPAIEGDATLLSQVLVNLIRNACEAMAEVPPAERRLAIECQAHDGELEITIRDAGPGISPADERRIFEPFVTTKRSGLGLGLAICRTIVDAHRGRIWADERSAAGAVFHVVLPIVAAEGKQHVA